MAEQINSNLVEIVKVNELPDIAVAVNNFFIQCGQDGVAGKTKIQLLLDYIVPLLSAYGSSGYVPTSSTTLPNPAGTGAYFTFVPAQTSIQSSGGTLITTAALNLLSRPAGSTVWGLSLAINLPDVTQPLLDLLDRLTFNSGVIEQKPITAYDSLDKNAANNVVSYFPTYNTESVNILVNSVKVKGSGTLTIVKSESDFSGITTIQDISLGVTEGTFSVPVKIYLSPGQRLGVKCKAAGTLSTFRYANPKINTLDVDGFASDTSTIIAMTIAFGYTYMKSLNDRLSYIEDITEVESEFRPMSSLDDMTQSLTTSNGVTYIPNYPTINTPSVVTSVRIKGKGYITIYKSEANFSSQTVVRDVYLGSTESIYVIPVFIKLNPGQRLGIRTKTSASSFRYANPKLIASDYNCYTSDSGGIFIMTIAFGYSYYVAVDSIVNDLGLRTENLYNDKKSNYDLKQLYTRVNLLLKASPLDFKTVTEVKFDGNSLTYGQGSSNVTTKSYPAQLHADLGDTDYAGWQNFAVAGQTVVQMLSDEYTQILSTYNFSTYGKWVLIVGGGINDIFGSGMVAEDVYANMKIYHNMAISAGIETIALTLTDCNKEYGVGVAVGNVQREKYNDMVRSGWQYDFGASAIVDLGADARIGVHKTTIDTTYFDPDGQHFNDTGYGVWKDLIKPALVSVAGSKTYGTQAVEPPKFTSVVRDGLNVIYSWAPIKDKQGVTYSLCKSDINNITGATQLYSGSGFSYTDTTNVSGKRYFYFLRTSKSGMSNSIYAVGSIYVP